MLIIVLVYSAVTVGTLGKDAGSVQGGTRSVNLWSSIFRLSLGLSCGVWRNCRGTREKVCHDLSVVKSSASCLKCPADALPPQMGLKGSFRLNQSQPSVKNSFSRIVCVMSSGSKISCSKVRFLFCFPLNCHFNPLIPNLNFTIWLYKNSLNV